MISLLCFISYVLVRGGGGGYPSYFLFLFFFQAEDGIRYLVRSRGLGDVYKRQLYPIVNQSHSIIDEIVYFRQINGCI